jgi:integrase
MKALILLGANCGLGNTDLAAMQMKHLDLERGWLTYSRPKTGVGRRAKLWPETVEAIRAAIKARPQPKSKEDAACVFLSVRGLRLVSTRTLPNAEGQGDVGPHKIVKTDDLTRPFAALLKRQGIEMKGISFYVMRHTFETIAGGSRDQVAVNLVMGHSDGSMAAEYRERVDDARLAAVATHVRSWLWPEQATAPPAEAPTGSASEAKPERPRAAKAKQAAGSRPTLRLFSAEAEDRANVG